MTPSPHDLATAEQLANYCYHEHHVPEREMVCQRCVKDAITAALTQAREEGRERLKRYGRHLNVCRYFVCACEHIGRSAHRTKTHCPCTCGFTDAMEGER